MRTLWIWAALLWGAPALAGEYYLESPEQDSRSAASEMTGAAEGDGRKVRVVRRHVDGAGWRFVLRVEGFDDEGTARDAAASLAAGIDAPVTVFEVEGRAATRVAEVGPATAEATGGQAEGGARPDDGDDDDDEPDWLDQAVEVHGVHDGTLSSILQGPTLLKYRRTLPDGSVLDHTWATRDGALYVEVAVVEGDAKPSRTVVVGDDAWLSVAGGEWTKQHGEKARMTLQPLGPGAVVPFVLALGSAVETRRELQRLEEAGTGEVDDVATRILRFEGDQTSGALTVELGVEDHRVRRVHFAEGDLEHRFGDFEEVAGVLVPTRIETRRGGQEGVDVVEIRELSATEELPSEWFSPPS